MSEYQKLLFDQLRLVTIKTGSASDVSNGNLIKAMTVNENLSGLGYTLNAADVLRLAASPSVDDLYDRVEGMIDQIKAEPMYPDFPQQVMSMEEAQFRFHQLVHYSSTYGLEALFGIEVSRGWLPSVKRTVKDRRDDWLLSAKVLELLDEDAQYIEPARRILRKRERMTIPELEIVAEAAQHLSAEEMQALDVPFKENLMTLAGAVYCSMDSEAALPLLRALFAHTGDVLDFAHMLLKLQRYRFKTSQKRLLVKLIERYPVVDWRANIILTGKKAKRSLLILNHIDYSMYSRSAAHMAVVDALRDGELRSWEGRVKALLADKDDRALVFIAARPGMLLRMTAWLLRLGYDKDEVARLLCERAASLSVQTLVTVLNFFGSDAAKHRAEAEDVYSVLERALLARLSLAGTPLRGKKVFLDNGDFDLAISTLKCSGKSAEGGYVPSGTVYKIPDDVRYVRFFTYWNDHDRVDIDLHVAAKTESGRIVRIGWNSAFCDMGVVFSGDITHSDAAEYIDVDLNGSVQRVAMNIHLFSGRENFAQIGECFAGLMAVRQNGENVRLYDPRNCFFSTHLRSTCCTMSFGYLDVAQRALVFDGIPRENAPSEWYRLEEMSAGRMNIARYIELLLEAQGCTPVACREEADVVLVVEKPMEDKEVSLIDHNYFMDAKAQE